MGEFEQYRATLSDYELLRSANCCRHAFEYQQSKIEQLEKRIYDALKVLNDASPTMLDKKAIRILRGEP